MTEMVSPATPKPNVRFLQAIWFVAACDDHRESDQIKAYQLVTTMQLVTQRQQMNRCDADVCPAIVGCVLVACTLFSMLGGGTSRRPLVDGHAKEWADVCDG